MTNPSPLAEKIAEKIRSCFKGQDWQTSGQPSTVTVYKYDIKKATDLIDTELAPLREREKELRGLLSIALLDAQCSKVCTNEWVELTYHILGLNKKENRIEDMNQIQTLAKTREPE